MTTNNEEELQNIYEIGIYLLEIVYDRRKVLALM